MFKTFILFFKFTFWLSSWWIAVSYLLVLIIATHISCIIIVNFLQLILIILLTTRSHFRSHLSYFLVTTILVVTRMSPLSSHLTIIMLSLMKLFFILLMFSTIWVMGWLWFKVNLLKHIITNFLAKYIKISCFYNSPCHFTSPLRSVPAYITAVSDSYFLLTIVSFFTLFTSFRMCSLSIMTYYVHASFIMSILSSFHISA